MDADTALLLVLDAYDACRVRTATKLFALHAELEAERQRRSQTGLELDAAAFTAAMRGFDPRVDEAVATDIYVQCQAAAAAAWAAATEEQREGMAEEALPRAAFVQACEEHGVRPSLGA